MKCIRRYYLTFRCEASCCSSRPNASREIAGSSGFLPIQNRCQKHSFACQFHEGQSQTQLLHCSVWVACWDGFKWWKLRHHSINQAQNARLPGECFRASFRGQILAGIQCGEGVLSINSGFCVFGSLAVFTVTTWSSNQRWFSLKYQPKFATGTSSPKHWKLLALPRVKCMSAPKHWQKANSIQYLRASPKRLTAIL